MDLALKLVECVLGWKVWLLKKIQNNFTQMKNKKGKMNTQVWKNWISNFSSWHWHACLNPVFQKNKKKQNSWAIYFKMIKHT